MARDPKQKHLDLAGADAAYAERMRDIEFALGRLPEKLCDAEMSLLLRLVFSYTQGGKAGPWKRSFAELAARPYGLCCSIEKAQATVETAETWTLLNVGRSRDSKGERRPNEYSLNSEGIAYVRQHGKPMPAGPPTSGANTPRHQTYGTGHQTYSTGSII